MPKRIVQSLGHFGADHHALPPVDAPRHHPKAPLISPPNTREGSAMAYLKFAAMIATSTVAMYGMMYLNTYSLDHVFWSQTRAWMALYMGAGMAVIMLAYMWGMYPHRRLNIAILLGAAVVFAASVYLLRSQRTVDDIAWMRAMIPHHSIAILTSERAGLTDPRVRALADEISATQRREIALMADLIADLKAQQ